MSVDIDLDKGDVGELALGLGEVRADELTWSTPSRPEVNDHDLVAVDLLSAAEGGKGGCLGDKGLTRVLNSS